MTSSMPLDVTAVEVKGTGADQTSMPLLKALIQPLLDAQGSQELGDAAMDVQRALFRTGVYQDIALNLAEKSPGETMAVLDLTAVKKIAVNTGTELGNGEGSGYIKGSLRNLLGLAEVLSFDVSSGTRTKSAHQVTLSAPAARLLSPKWQFDAVAYSSQSNVEFASHTEQIRGATARISNLNHTLGIDSVLRSIYVYSKFSGLAVRNQAGNSVKNSVHHSWIFDSRDNKLIPTTGNYMKITSELATGNYPFLKSQIDCQSGFRLSPLVTGSLGVKAGVLHPLAGAESHIMDRFFLGGPLDLRGFKMFRVGPQDRGDFLGGTMLGAASLSLYSKVPRVKSENFKLHAFVGAGSLGNHKSPTFIEDMKHFSSSFGLGLLYTHSQIRFELNFVFPLTAASSDHTHKGFQCGIGLNFL